MASNKTLSPRYQRRLDRGAARGWSRAAARGHGRPPKGGEPGAPVETQRVLEQALRQVASGTPLKKAAAEARVASERLRAYLGHYTSVTLEGGRLRILDRRPRVFPVYSDGQLKAPTLSPVEASKAGRYLNDVQHYLDTGEIDRIEVHRAQGVTDVKGKFVPFEVGPNMLRRLDAAGELYFPEFYKILGAEA